MKMGLNPPTHSCIGGVFRGLGGSWSGVILWSGDTLLGGCSFSIVWMAPVLLLSDIIERESCAHAAGQVFGSNWCFSSLACCIPSPLFCPRCPKNKNKIFSTFQHKNNQIGRFWIFGHFQFCSPLRNQGNEQNLLKRTKQSLLMVFIIFKELLWSGCFVLVHNKTCFTSINIAEIERLVHFWNCRQKSPDAIETENLAHTLQVRFVALISSSADWPICCTLS